MPHVSSRQTDAMGRLWDKYIKYIVVQGVKQSVARWYVIRVEQYLKAFPDSGLRHGIFCCRSSAPRQSRGLRAAIAVAAALLLFT